jgi:predicted AAA+ superfamily ATPase
VSFFEENPPPLILDEIQQATELLPHVKERVDADRRPGAWLLTGSQAFGLMRGVAESLAGRVAVLQLDPLSTRETRGLPSRDPIEQVFGAEPGAAKAAGDGGSGPRLDDWLLRGSYPEPRLNERVDRELWFSSYVQTYLERDVRELVQVGDLGSFHRFVRLLADRTGQLLNLAELGRDTGVTAPTARRWLSVLEASQVVHLLQPHHRNFGKRIRKSPKVYWLDPGLPSFLLGLRDEESVLRGPTAGPLAEGAVVSEWLKALRQRGDGTEPSFWRSAAGLEVDLVLERDGVLHGVEVKATRTPTPHHADALARWLELAGRGARGVLACRVEAPAALRPGIRAVPWHLAW